jgi:hypothetical protein
MKIKFISRIFGSILFIAVSLDGITAEVRTSAGTPKIGDRYQNSINLDGKRKLILPDGVWEVNNVFDDKEVNWHAAWKVITLTNEEPSSPFRMTFIHYFSASVSRWPAEECEKKSNQFAFGHDTTGSKGGRSVCSNFFVWANPQELITLSLPKFYNFYWAKALSKLPKSFVDSLEKDMLQLEVSSSTNGGLLVRQDIIIDAKKIGINVEDFKKSYSASTDELAKKTILNWRVAYGQSMAQSFLDSLDVQPEIYSLKIQGTPKLAANSEPKASNQKQNSDTQQAPPPASTSTNTEQQLAIERKKLDQEKLMIEEQKKLAEEKRKLEEDKKQVEIDSIRRQKELMALQEERRQIEQKQLDKLQEDKLRQEKLAAAQAEAKAKADEERVKKEQERLLAEEAKKREQAELKEAIERKRAADQARAEEEKRKKDLEAATLAEKRKQQEEEKRAAAELKKAEEEERKKIEAYKKSPPTIEVSQSEPDEFGAVILDITVSKPTKSLTINGEVEGASKDGKYRVKRILKKTGKTNFSFVAIDEYGNRGAHSFSATLTSNNDFQNNDNKSAKFNKGCWSTQSSCLDEYLLKLSLNEESKIKAVATWKISNGTCDHKRYFEGKVYPHLGMPCAESNGEFSAKFANGCTLIWNVVEKKDPLRKLLAPKGMKGNCSEDQKIAQKELIKRGIVDEFTWVIDQASEMSENKITETNQTVSPLKVGDSYDPGLAKRFVSLVGCETPPNSNLDFIMEYMKIISSQNVIAVTEYEKTLKKIGCTILQVAPSNKEVLNNLKYAFSKGNTDYLTASISKGFRTVGGVPLPSWYLFGIAAHR